LGKTEEITEILTTQPNLTYMKIRDIYYKRKALNGLKRKYYLDIAINEHLKDWVTDCIINRKQEHRRKELVELEGTLKEQYLFLEWLNNR
jgi:hypothetical protein